MEDRELLQNFLVRRSDEAFAELVRRHLDLVYSAALRVVRDPGLAKDVCQSVFLRLARKAASVRQGNALSGWLYRAACFEAASALRSEQRRRQREVEALRRAELNQDAGPDWGDISPLLEEAMCQLSRVEQNALVLRFFEDKPLAEVGRLLGLTDEAARKRISRALERLRAHFTRRGVRVGASTLASMLAANAVEAAPAGLALSITTASLAAATAAGSAGLISTLMPALLMTKTSLAITGTLLLGAVLTPLLLSRFHSHRARPEAEAGPITSSSPTVAKTSMESSSRPVSQPIARPSALLARVAALPPLTPAQIEAYVEQNKRSAESLLAAYRMGADRAYLTEAASRFPTDPDVQYAQLMMNLSDTELATYMERVKLHGEEAALAWLEAKHGAR